MTATPAQTPRRMPKFSCSHACAFSMHPCGKTHVSLHAQPQRACPGLCHEQPPHAPEDNGVSRLEEGTNERRRLSDSLGNTQELEALSLPGWLGIPRGTQASCLGCF